MLFYGRILGIAPAKTVFLTVVGVFELGSLLCAIAPSVNVLIFGRVVAGVGASGLMVSVMYIIAKVLGSWFNFMVRRLGYQHIVLQVTTIRQRPIFMGVFGAVYAVASIIGPLLGGVFSGTFPVFILSNF